MPQKPIWDTPQGPGQHSLGDFIEGLGQVSRSTFLEDNLASSLEAKNPYLYGGINDPPLPPGTEMWSAEYIPGADDLGLQGEFVQARFPTGELMNVTVFDQDNFDGTTTINVQAFSFNFFTGEVFSTDGTAQAPSLEWWEENDSGNISGQQQTMDLSDGSADVGGGGWGGYYDDYEDPDSGDTGD